MKVFIKRKSKPEPENSSPFRKPPLNRLVSRHREYSKKKRVEIQYSKKQLRENRIESKPEPENSFPLCKLWLHRISRHPKKNLHHAYSETSENTVFKGKFENLDKHRIRSRPSSKDRGVKIRYTKLDGGEERCEEGGNQVRRFSATTEPWTER